jgi:amino acid adenylation domain-containing protein
MRPAQTSSVYGLSPLQQGMLSHHSGRRAGGVDLVQIVISLPEALSRDAFARAWEWLAARHEILRTAFRWDQPTEPPHQEFRPTVSVPFAWHDWRDLGEAIRRQWWTQLLERDRARGFDLASAPLWRVTVVQEGAHDHRVLFSFHHLLLDARSLLVLLPDLFSAHDAFVAGTEPVAGPACDYHGYLEWLPTRDTTGSAAYWRRQLAGFPVPTPLPAASFAAHDAAEPRGPSDRTRRLTSAETSVLRSFARRENVTLNTLVQGAWALLLSRCSGETEVLFGAVRACRHGSAAGAGEMVGPMINTLPLRVAVPPAERVGAWLRGLRRQWLEMRAHEHDALSEIRASADIPAGIPLFETIVSYQEPSWDAALAARGGAWTRRRFEVRNQINHPLALDAAGGTELQLRISYDARRFAASAIERMLGHVATLLAGLAADAAATLATLPLLTSAEEAQLLDDWSRGPALTATEATIPGFVATQAARTPRALAVSDSRGAIDYATLEARSTQIAQHLRARGVRPNVFVGVCVDSSINLVTALLGVLRAGGAYVPMDPAYPAGRLEFMLRDAAIPLVIAPRRLASLFAGSDVPVLVLEDALAEPAPLASSPARPATPDDPAYLIYTSGSTGQPKGVPVRHRQVANLIAWHRQTYSVGPGDRATQIASPAFDACVWELWPHLAAGASVHIPDPEVRVSPARLVRWLVDTRITLCFLPTPLAEAMLDESWPERCALRAILTGGDRLRRWPDRSLPCALVNHYGPTENTVVSTWAQVPLNGDGAAAPAIGRPLPNTEAYVLDRSGRPVPVGVAGELHVGGASLADGYHRRPELTAEKFVPHPFSQVPGARLYRTGDLVRWREDGQLEYLGRIDQQVKIRGHRIEPGEIEHLLNAEPAVRESLVLARNDAAGEPQLVAYLLPGGGERPDPVALAQSLHRRLPAYMVPAAFVTVDAWPLTAHGKVDRAALPAPVAPPARKVPPRPGVEATVARIWGEVLGCSNLGAHDDFFLVGGHSLRAAQVVSRLNSAYRASLSVRHLFEHSTVAGLAAVIEQQAADQASAAPSVTLPA